MKVQKMVYLDRELNERLKKLGRFQSELINAILEELLDRISEEELAAYRVRHGSFGGILAAVFFSQKDIDVQKSSTQQRPPEEKTGRAVLEREVEQIW